MDIINQLISDFKPNIILGAIMIIVGIVVPVFKMYWLIAGVNTTPKEKLKQMDLKYLGKIFGIFLSLLGLLMILLPLVFLYFELIAYLKTTLVICELSVVVFMFVFLRIKKNRIYYKNL